ncbi:MAG: DUF2141 domain-containing protein [Deltaproteobacteria bacterium]|nr:DUF2141 domain-containing protein [Deltaproteobacteria bacterium]
MIYHRVTRCLKAATAALLLAFAGAPAADAESTSLGTLSVVPVGLENSRGTLLAQLSNVAATFEGEGEPFRSAEMKVVDGQAVVVFEDVPHGDYALKVFHDENDNQKLDTNFVGMPKEKFGFSNDVMGRFGPPSFEQARFRFEEPATILRVEMK